MYCPSCGAALAQGLSYCNRCGANLNATKGSGAANLLEKQVESTVWAIVVVTIVVLGIMLGAIALMKEIGLSGELNITLAGVIFLALVAIDSVFVWQILRINRRIKEAEATSQSEKFNTNELNAKQEPSLLESMLSVTENTTRMFQPTATRETRGDDMSPEKPPRA